ncbi:MAG: hypothetical protein WC307_00675 [Candidatus Nanoarchaeia archaeon]|jgi:hypothetical protein
MGLDDWEDIIPGIVIVISILALIGGIANFVPAIKSVTWLYTITNFFNNIFMYVAAVITPYIPLQAIYMAIIIEILMIIFSIIFILKVTVL